MDNTVYSSFVCFDMVKSVQYLLQPSENAFVILKFAHNLNAMVYTCKGTQKHTSTNQRSVGIETNCFAGR